MKLNKTYIIILVVTAITQMNISCKKQLDVGNPNQPTLDQNITNESGIISLAKGAVYINGFQRGDDWLGNSYFSLPWGYLELLGDNLGAEASNNQITTIGVPDYITLSNGTKLINSAPSVNIIRAYNNRASTGAGNNAIYYQWLNMYALNNACNSVLTLVDGIPFSGDAASKANTIKAWCYFWKGYAYGVIGTLYYSGLINNEEANNNYVLHDAVIEESNKYYDLAEEALKSVSNASDYSNVLGELIPDFCQVGNGGVLTTTMWIHSINTMKARNILLNKLSPFVNGSLTSSISNASTSAITAQDWNNILTLAADGIDEGDYVFTGRSTDANGFFSAGSGTAAAETTGPNTSNTFKISERFIQNFKVGDKRLENNFNTGSTFKNDYSFATRWNMVDGGNGLPGVYVYGSQAVGDYEVYIAGSYEENTLMLAEANIRLGSIEKGLAYIDAVRDYMGAGIAHVAGKGLTQAQAMQELVMERRVALIFRGITFFDNRRWGWSYDISKGGGYYNAYIYNSTTGVLDTKATINYNYMDYWDVPADESVLNPPGDGSVEVVNPNY